MKQSLPYDLPITLQIDSNTGALSPCPEIIQRRVSDLAGMFTDQAAVEEILRSGDRVLYEFRYHPFLTSKSDLALGTTIIYPGKVGEEYHMTKGHYHQRDDQPEIYHCLQGEGLLLMENRAGDFHTTAWTPGTATHIPPQFAHRVVNIGSTPLVFVAVYHLSAGHDYGSIEASGFRSIIVERSGKMLEVPNPRRGVQPVTPRM